MFLLEFCREYPKVFYSVMYYNSILESFKQPKVYDNLSSPIGIVAFELEGLIAHTHTTLHIFLTKWVACC